MSGSAPSLSNAMTASRRGLITCSVCVRVHHAGAWLGWPTEVIGAAAQTRGVEGARLGVSGRALLLGVAAKDALAEFAVSSLVGELNRIDPVRLHGIDGDALPGNHASEMQAGLEILEFRHGD
jgi:hypothetical protein